MFTDLDNNGLKKKVITKAKQWTFPLSDKILKKIEIGKSITDHSLKEHPTFTKISKFGCEML